MHSQCYFREWKWYPLCNTGSEVFNNTFKKDISNKLLDRGEYSIESYFREWSFLMHAVKCWKTHLIKLLFNKLLARCTQQCSFTAWRRQAFCSACSNVLRTLIKMYLPRYLKMNLAQCKVHVHEWYPLYNACIKVFKTFN